MYRENCKCGVKEGTYYTAFGLTMGGISSKASMFGEPENKYKFNKGTELNNDLDIGLYETPFRSYDPQLGRFHQLDKLGEISDSWSPYVFASNNPILRNDPLGLKDTVVNGQLGETKQLDNVTVSPKKSKSSSLGFATALPLAATANFSSKFSVLGPEAVAIAAAGFTIYNNWDEIQEGLTTSLDASMEARFLAMLSDPAIIAQLEKIIAMSDAIVAELNKIPGDDYQVYQIVATQPTQVLDIKWGGLLSKKLFTPQIVTLNTGGVAKIGITSKPLIIGSSTLIARYTKSQVPANTIGVPVSYTKNKIAARFVETTLLIKYYIANQKLPPMNTMFR
jgi:RHS repeat-associated protein